MPIPQIKLHDLTAEQLVEELVNRIPGHTPEWRHARPGDPGRTLIELFAWLGDKLLYRVNLLPERQRLMFLRLLGMPLKPAVPARGIVDLSPSNPGEEKAVKLGARALVKGAGDFETLSPITVLPVTGSIYIKRKPSDVELSGLSEVISGIEQLYRIGNSAPYITTPLFTDGLAEPAGVDVVQDSVDQSVWIALLANKPELVASLRDALPGTSTDPNLLNIGLQPRQALDEEEPQPESSSTGLELWQWEISSADTDDNGAPQYIPIGYPKNDTTAGYSRRGTFRLELQTGRPIGVPTEDDGAFAGGMGNRPPRIDDEEISEKIVAWVRMRPRRRVESLPLSWIGINATEVENWQTVRNVALGTSTGAPDQVFALPATSVDPDSLVIQVEGGLTGYETWSRIDDLALANRDDKVFSLNSESGEITLGDRMRGTVPARGKRVRVLQMRSGGGAAGNLSPGSLTTIAHPRLKASQPIDTSGGEDAETLDQAEKRIPAMLQHRGRAVVADDYVSLARETPGFSAGRVEVLPRFRPFERRNNVPGVVSVMIIPPATRLKAPNPRADRAMISRVSDHLDKARPIGTELYVIGTEYRSISLSISIALREGFGSDQVFPAVDTALRRFLFPTAPGGREGTGWPLGQTVSNLELEVTVARVTGVRAVLGINLFEQINGRWSLLAQNSEIGAQMFRMEEWQLPELRQISIVLDEPNAPDEIVGLVDGESDETIIAIPVVPEVC